MRFFRHAQTDHVIYGEKWATNTHTDCTPNTHTDGTKHTHGLHTNTHILLPIVVFAIKTGTKTHTYLERKSFFFLDGGSRSKKYFCLFGSPGAPDTVKYDMFGNAGAL